MTTLTIYDALRESHEIQRTLFRKLLRSKPGDQERLNLFDRVRLELAAHEAAEERYLYVPMMMHDLGLDASRHAWLERAKTLSRQLHHHLREEERKFFQVSGKLLSAAQKVQLGTRYRRDYLRMHRMLAAQPR